MAPLPDTGRYTITNVKFNNHAVLLDANDFSDIVGRAEKSEDGEKWNVTLLSNRKYTLQNHGFSNFAACDARPVKDESVNGRRSEKEWTIKESRVKGRFTISPIDNPDLFWGLAQADPGTPITLAATATDQKNQWLFHPAPLDLNTQPAFDPPSANTQEDVSEEPVNPPACTHSAPVSSEDDDDHAASIDSYFHLPPAPGFGNEEEGQAAHTGSSPRSLPSDSKLRFPTEWTDFPSPAPRGRGLDDYHSPSITPPSTDLFAEAQRRLDSLASPPNVAMPSHSYITRFDSHLGHEPRESTMPPWTKLPRSFPPAAYPRPSGFSDTFKERTAFGESDSSPHWKDAPAQQAAFIHSDSSFPLMDSLAQQTAFIESDRRLSPPMTGKFTIKSFHGSSTLASAGLGSSRQRVVPMGNMTMRTRNYR